MIYHIFVIHIWLDYILHDYIEIIFKGFRFILIMPLELLHTSYACLSFAASLWHPEGCTVCMTHYKMGWVQEDVDLQTRTNAIESLKGWVLVFRKSAKKGAPFFLEEAWRSLVLPDTDKRFVYDESVHGSGINIEALIDLHSAAATSVDLHAPSTSGQVPLRTAAVWKMSSLKP